MEKLYSYFYIGVDIGQAQDYTAIAIVERLRYSDTPDLLEVRRIQRLPLGLPYKGILEEVEKITNIEIEGKRINPKIILDYTGVGRPVYEMFRERLDNVIGVTITGGTSETQEDYTYNIPKKDLISNLQILLENKEIKFYMGIPDDFIRELQNYRARINENANAIYEPRQQDHDDMVLALSLACWKAVRDKAEEVIIVCPPGDTVKSRWHIGY